MTSAYIRQSLPSSFDLPGSDDTPVDNEDQNLLPNLLLLLLMSIWAERMDWYFGVDMAVYHTTGANPKIPVVPDAFLSLGVERRKDGDSRRSYVMWEEEYTVPQIVLEMVSHKPGGEYDKKPAIYAKLGVPYYVVYNPEFWERDNKKLPREEWHQPFEVYKLESGIYRRQSGEPYWIPEIGLGIGRYDGEVGGIPQEILTWYDEQGRRYLSEAEQVRLEVEQEKRRRESLESFLRSQGFDPDNLPS